MLFKWMSICTAALALCGSGLTSALAQETVLPSRSVATYGNWSVACNMVALRQSDDTTQTEEQCELVSQVNVRSEDGSIRPLLEVSVGSVPGDDTMRILFQVPGNAYLRSPVSLILDPPKEQPGDVIPEDALNATFIRCDTGRCLADTILSGSDWARLNSAQTVIVSFVNVSGSRIGVPLSMNGHQAAARDMLGR